MTKIDAQLATQVGDAFRPVATQLDQQQQASFQRVRAMKRSDEPVLSVADPSPDQVRSAAEEIRKVIETASGRQLSFGVDDSGKNLLVKVIGKDGTVVRQIPSKEILELQERIHALVGALVDEKA